MAAVGLYVSATVDLMIRHANPDSPTIPMQDLIAATNVWVFYSLICKDWRSAHD